MKSIFLVAAASLMLVACSSGGSGTGGSTSKSAFATLYDAIGSAMLGSSASSSVLSTNSGMRNVGTFAFPADFTGAIWPAFNDDPIMNNRTGAQYLGDLVSDSSDKSVIGQFTTGLMIACFLDLYAEKGTDGKLAVGTGKTMTIQSSWAQSGCPGASNLPSMLFGGTIGYSVTDISADGVYDRKVQMLGTDTPFGTDQWMYLKSENGVVTFAHDEIQSPSVRSVNFAFYNPTTQVIRAQYITNNANLENIYRFYSNGVSDTAALLAHHAFSSTETWVVLTGKPSNLDIVTVAAAYSGLGGGASGTNETGCFNFANSTLNGGGSSFGTCGNSITGINASGISITTAIHASNAVANTFLPNFTEANIKTAATGMP